MQICTLQATLNSLSESYTPTWQSKHFFEEVNRFILILLLIDY